MFFPGKERYLLFADKNTNEPQIVGEQSRVLGRPLATARGPDQRHGHDGAGEYSQPAHAEIIPPSAAAGADG